MELKSGFSGNGPAWIGKGFYNRTRKTVYFNGHVFCRSKGISGNHIDLETGEEVWISGIKKNGTDRHWSGSGTIQIEEDSIEEYLGLRNLSSLPKGKFIVAVLDNEPAKAISNALQNGSIPERFEPDIRFKSVSELTDIELEQLINYYQELDMSSIPKKARKEFIGKLDKLVKTKDIRENKNNIPG